MGRILFDKADPAHPADKGGKRWLHRKSGKALRKDGSYRLVDPVYFYPGEEYPVDAFEEAWLLTYLPQCFKPVAKKDGGKSKKAKSDSDSVGEQ